MRATVWGCRGSVAAPGPATVRYGGNTSCVEVRLGDGTVCILDAGTGIRDLGVRLAGEGLRRVHLFLTHLHLDHLQGLAFFAPLYDPDVELHVWGPPSPVACLEDRVGVYMSEPLFPVSVRDIPCRVEFHDAPLDGCRLGPATVWSSPVAHRGPTVGYRIEEAGRAVTYIPDHEPGRVTDLRTVDPSWMSGYDLAAGADVLLHDAQYSEAEYPDHVGWGHSSIEQVVTFALRAEVGRLVLFHHDPSHDDATVEALAAVAAAGWRPGSHPPEPAYEGMVIDLEAPPAAAGLAGARSPTTA